jgi:hypothetical protein
LQSLCTLEVEVSRRGEPLTATISFRAHPRDVERLRREAERQERSTGEIARRMLHIGLRVADVNQATESDQLGTGSTAP